MFLDVRAKPPRLASCIVPNYSFPSISSIHIHRKANKNSSNPNNMLEHRQKCGLIILLNNHKLANRCDELAHLKFCAVSFSISLQPSADVDFLKWNISRVEKTCLHSNDDQIFNAVKLKYRQCINISSSVLVSHASSPHPRLHCVYILYIETHRICSLTATGFMVMLLLHVYSRL